MELVGYDIVLRRQKIASFLPDVILLKMHFQEHACVSYIMKTPACRTSCESMG